MNHQVTDLLPARRATRRIRREQFRQARHVHGGSLVNMLIAFMGVKLARLRIPSQRLRASLYRKVFTTKYPPGINEAEMEQPLSAYTSLNALFTRGLKPEFRPIATSPLQFLSPCDGTVQELGRLQHDKLYTLKGVEYSLVSLLPSVDPRPFADGHYAIIFLSPLDCHRIFSPQDGQLVEAIHVPGYRLPVHPPCQRNEYPVYALNERMILRLSTALGPCLVVLVAGWGVGNISLPAAPAFRPQSHQWSKKAWDNPIPIKRGEWLATFELGSTAMLIAPPAMNALPLVAPNAKVKYGESIFAYAG